MGYRTQFEGEFACSRDGNHHIGVFLNAIREGDRTALAPLADWLTDHGDARGEAVARLAKKPPKKLKALWSLFGLRPEHAAYLRAFANTRRIRRDARRAKYLPDPLRHAVGLPLGPHAGYYVGNAGEFGNGGDAFVIDENEPPKGQPGLWCQWVPTDDGTAIVWDGGEKFYYHLEWLHYLLDHFLKPWGYVLNGKVTWQGEDPEDVGIILVVDNVVRTSPG
jgi:hypothetical protein